MRPRRLVVAARARRGRPRRSRPSRSMRAARDHPWRPPSGLAASAPARTATGLARPLRVRRSRLQAITLHVAVIPATRQPARGRALLPRGRAGRSGDRRPPSRSTRSSRTSASTATSCSSTSAARAARIRMACPQEHVPCDRRGRASPRTSAAASRGSETGRALLTTTVAADDIERVRRALGYGPHRHLRQLLRRHARAGVPAAPSRARCARATLDGASLPERSRVYELAAPQRRARADGRASPAVARRNACRHAFPDTRGGARARARAAHVLGSADELATTIAALLRSPEDAARVPLLDPPGRGRRRRAARARVRRARRQRARRPLAPRRWSGRSSATSAGRASTWPRRTRASRGQLPRARDASRAHASSGTACAGVPRAGTAVRGGRGRRACRSCCSPATPIRSDPPANLRGWRRRSPTAASITVPGLAHGVDRLRLPASRRRALRRRGQRARPRRELRAPRAAAALRAQLAAGAGRATATGLRAARGDPERGDRCRGRRRSRRRRARRARRRRRRRATRRSPRGRTRARRRRCRTRRRADGTCVLAPEALPMCSGSADPSAAEATFGSTSAMPTPIATSGATSSA